MTKNVVVCCDGTGNAFARDMTNVLRLYYSIERDIPEQVTHYRPGIGTMAAPGAITPLYAQLTKVLSQGFGYGIERDILAVYTFINQNYDKEDKVFLFGFSRGAYIVRAVASILHTIGVIRKGDEPLILYIISMLNQISNDRNKDGAHQVFRSMHMFSEMYSRGRCPIWFMGVWDTVSESPVTVPYILRTRIFRSLDMLFRLTKNVQISELYCSSIIWQRTLPL